MTLSHSTSSAPRRVVRRLAAVATALIAGTVCVLSSPAAADDRVLLTQGGAKPYVFVILDTSGSMNWQPGGDGFAPMSGDDPTSKMYQAKSALFRVMLDPELDGIRWGFGSYNQDQTRVYRKHWQYQIRNAPPFATNSEDFHYPMPGFAKTFGDSCMNEGDGCTFDGNDELGSCGSTWDLHGGTERLLEAYHFPVTGNAGNLTTEQWIEHDGHRYELIWELDSGSLGDTSIEVELTLRRYADCDADCDNDCGSTPNTTTVFGPYDLWFDRVVTQDAQGRPLPGANQTLAWMQDGSSGGTDPWSYEDTATSGTCEGIETNSDTTTDKYSSSSSYTVKMATVADPVDATVSPSIASRGTPLQRGDFVPLDWKDEAVWLQGSVPNAFYRYSNLDFILRRLAPNWDPTNPASVPDFRAAPYFDNSASSTGRLPLKAGYYTGSSGTNNTYRTPPLYGSGSTPLGNSLDDFRVWFDSWKPKAQAGDSKFTCRSTSVVLLTDGDETCYGGSTTGSQDSGGDWNPCHVADRLWKQSGRNVRTFVVGFGLQDSGNFLGCIADKGGTAAKDYDNDGEIDGPGVILPGNENDLVAALKAIFTQIREGSASFASAAVPSVQADAADKVFLTEFTPVSERAVWPGRFYAFVKPVPLNEANRPDLTKDCTVDRTAACFAWESQDVVVEQQVKGSEANPIGNAENQRRVFYSELRTAPKVPTTRHYLGPDTSSMSQGQLIDLWQSLNLLGGDCDADNDGELIDDVFDNNESDGPACHHEDLVVETDAVLGTALELKKVLPPGGSLIEYVIGDNFHSDPLSIGEPSNVRYFVADVGVDLTAGPDACLDEEHDDKRRYRSFAIQNRQRRRMLALGTNDGLLHVFDTGVYRYDTNTNTGRFDNGTGRELFAFAPRSLLATYPDLYDPAHWDDNTGNSNPRPYYGVDGRPVAADVLIDPIHEGWGSSDEPERCDRRWRTVLVGGLREGVSTIREEELPLGISASSDLIAGGYYALDVTKPDHTIEEKQQFLWVPKVNGDAPPSCFGDGEGNSLNADCDSVPFAMPIWEFHDTLSGIRLDEDGNGQIDLAATWSTPNLGRIRVCTADCGGDPDDDVLEDRFVAIFGGGLDPANPFTRGNWLYIVDVETGQALYKQPLLGGAPGEPAAVDTDLDGYLDRIYIGTMYGFMYRVDLVQDDPNTVEVERIYPRLVTTTYTVVNKAGTALPHTLRRIIDPAFAPRILFSATASGASENVSSVLNNPSIAKPIFFRPSVIFVPQLERYAIAFGTGNREDLTLRNQPDARFFVYVDDRAWNQLADDVLDVPVNKSALQAIDLSSSAMANAGQNFLVNRSPGQRGWYVQLAPDERMVTEPVTIAGVLVFTFFSPRTTVIGDGICEETGTSRIFATLATNAEGLLFNPGTSTRSRFKSVADLVTQPFAEQSQTKNPPGPLDELQEGEELLDDNLRLVENLITRMMPETCRFVPGFRTDLKTRDSKTGIEWIAPIPLCVIEKNFREF